MVESIRLLSRVLVIFITSIPLFCLDDVLMPISFASFLIVQWMNHLMFHLALSDFELFYYVSSEYISLEDLGSLLFF